MYQIELRFVDKQDESNNKTERKNTLYQSKGKAIEAAEDAREKWIRLRVCIRI